MAALRSFGHYSQDEVLDDGQFLTVMDVREHQWLLEHSHDFPEIVYVLGGSGTQYLNGVPVPIREGDIYLIPLGTTHVFRPAVGERDNAGLRVRDIIVRAEWLEQWMRTVPDEDVRDLMAWLLGQRDNERKTGKAGSPAWFKITDAAGRLRRQTEELKELLGAKPAAYRTRLAAGLLTLLCSLTEAIRQVQLRQTQEPNAEANGPAPLSKARIVQAIETVRLRDATLAGTASALDISPRHLSRLFPKHFGMTFQHYIRELRLKESERLLLESDLSVKAIMEQTGCKDADHFYKQFKLKTGLAPGQYRSRFRM